MKAGVRFVCALFAALVLLPALLAPANAQMQGKVYLMRGLANVFSYGMDDLASKMRGRGIDANVYEYGQWQALADDAVAWSRANSRAPVVIMGHSLGADAAITMAERMTSLGIPPRLVVTFDPVGVTQVGASGGKFINYYQSNNGFGKRLASGAGFKGQLVNRNLDSMGTIDHFNIDKSAVLHSEVIADVVAVMRRPRPKPAPAPVAAPIAGAPVSAAPEAAAPVAQPAAAPSTASSVQSVSQQPVR